MSLITTKKLSLIRKNGFSFRIHEEILVIKKNLPIKKTCSSRAGLNQKHYFNFHPTARDWLLINCFSYRETPDVHMKLKIQQRNGFYAHGLFKPAVLEGFPIEIKVLFVF